VTFETIDYAHGDVALKGRLVRPEGTPRGAILILPTIANINANMERRATMLADLGFVAMVADFYGEPVESFEASFPMGNALRADVDHYRARLVAGLDALARPRRG
jgi:dienelactone hydrolase